MYNTGICCLDLSAIIFSTDLVVILHFYIFFEYIFHFHLFELVYLFALIIWTSFCLSLGNLNRACVSARCQCMNCRWRLPSPPPISHNLHVRAQIINHLMYFHVFAIMVSNNRTCGRQRVLCLNNNFPLYRESLILNSLMFSWLRSLGGIIVE
jgi:hypothetical protein